MRHPGDRDGAFDLDPATVERLRAHAAAIASAASVPARARADMIEELHGHLVERALAFVAHGAHESDAADQAIAGFGGVAELATDLSGAFHSRLWTSTIGVLLPAVFADPGLRPGVVGWLRFVLGLGVVVSVIGIGAAVWFGPPGHALLTAVLIGLGVVGLWLAFRALARGQRWALWYGIGFCLELLVYGIGSVVAPEVPGSIQLPVGGLLGGGVLLGVMSAWGRLRTFVAGSRPISRGLLALLGVSLVGSAATGPALALLPDPTQASVDDFRLNVSVACDRGDVVQPDFPTLADVQLVTITADMAWRQGDILPNGLHGALNPAYFGDSAGFRLSERAMAHWNLVPQDPAVVDVASGATAGWFGASTNSGDLLPETSSIFTISIDPEAIEAGRTLRATWLLAADSEAPWPLVHVAYAHLDRFLVQATAECGETSVGEELPLPQPGQQQPDPLDGMFP